MTDKYTSVDILFHFDVDADNTSDAKALPKPLPIPVRMEKCILPFILIGPSQGVSLFTTL